MTLKELLTAEEIDWIFKSRNRDVLLKEYEELTIHDLTGISLYLIETEFEGQVPQFILAAKAIEILVERGIKLGYKI
jgi:hypothetical protein